MDDDAAIIEGYRGVNRFTLGCMTAAVTDIVTVASVGFVSTLVVTLQEQ